MGAIEAGRFGIGVRRFRLQGLGLCHDVAFLLLVLGNFGLEVFFFCRIKDCAEFQQVQLGADRLVVIPLVCRPRLFQYCLVFIEQHLVHEMTTLVAD